MPHIDLKPTEYREKRRFLYRITHATRGQLWTATALGIWAAAVWFMRFSFDFMPNALITALIAFGPGVVWYLYLAVTDD